MSSDCQMRWKKHQRVSEVPSISITSSRRVSVSSPLRFTRTFSEDSLDSLERTGRRELHRQQIMLSAEETDFYSLSPSSPSSPQFCPNLGVMGRSHTEPSTNHPQRSPLVMKRSTGDLVSSSQPSSSKKTLAEFIGLTPYQHRLLSQCWPNIFSTGSNGQFATSIYSNLSNKCAKARLLLAKANGVAVFAQSEDCSAMHARVTVELIDTAVRNLDEDHHRLTEYIVEVGRAHRHLKAEGLNTSVWDELGDCIIDSLRRYEIVRKHKELRRGWLALVAYLIDNLKQGQSILRSSGSSYEIAEKPGSPAKKMSNS